MYSRCMQKVTYVEGYNAGDSLSPQMQVHKSTVFVLLFLLWMKRMKIRVDIIETVEYNMGKISED